MKDSTKSWLIHQNQYPTKETKSMGGTAIGALIDGLFGLIGTGINNWQMDKTNKENRDYATMMTNAQWERDDSSLQRQVKDAQLAGLSPLAVTGSMNSSSPLNYTAQAPQMDLSSLIGLASSAGSQIEQMQHESDENDKERNFLDSQNAKKMMQELKIWNEDLKNRQDALSIDIMKFNQNLQYQYKVLSQNKKEFKEEKDLSRLQSLSNSSFDLYTKMCESLGVTPKVKYTSDVEEYYDMLGTFYSKYGIVALKRGTSGISDNTSQTIGNTTGVNAGAGKYGSAGITSSEEESATIDMAKTNSYYDMSELGNVFFPIFSYSEESDYDDSEYKYEGIKYDFK